MWVWLLLAACGPAAMTTPPDAGLPPPGLDAGHDAGTPDAGLPPQPCRLTPQVAVEEVGEGVAFEIPVASEAGAVLTLSQPGGYWETSLSNGALKAVVPYGARGTNTFGVQVTCRGLTVEDTVAVKVRPITWGAGIKWAAGMGPSGREHPLMWIDPRVPSKLWLYGGFTFVPKQFTVSNDLWAFDLVQRTWAAQTMMSGTAPLLAGGRAAVGSESGRLWLLGGQAPSDAVSSAVTTLDTSGAMPAFTDVPADPNAPKVTLGALVYDAPRDRLVSACGFAGNSVHCEVRVRPASGTDPKWEVVTTQGTPPAGRYGFFHAYDAKNQRLVLFSGAQWPVPGDPINAAKDTWALELDQSPPRWVKLADARPDVVGRRNGCAALDPDHQRFFVWSGTADGLNAVAALHVLALRKGHERWTTLYLEGAPTPRGSCSAAYDAVRQQVLFGFGNDLTGPMVDLQPLEL
jgi:hypothetical protein